MPTPTTATPTKSMRFCLAFMSGVPVVVMKPVPVVVCAVGLIDRRASKWFSGCAAKQQDFCDQQQEGDAEGAQTKKA
jgi:hypothetical protein